MAGEHGEDPSPGDGEEVSGEERGDANASPEDRPLFGTIRPIDASYFAPDLGAEFAAWVATMIPKIELRLPRVNLPRFAPQLSQIAAECGRGFAVVLERMSESLPPNWPDEIDPRRGPGHHEAAQALAVTVAETAIARTFGNSYTKVKKQVLFDPDLIPFIELRLRAALAPIAPFYTAWRPEWGTPAPPALSRHVCGSAALHASQRGRRRPAGDLSPPCSARAPGTRRVGQTGQH